MLYRPPKKRKRAYKKFESCSDKQKGRRTKRIFDQMVKDLEQAGLKFNGTETNHSMFFFHATNPNPNWVCLSKIVNLVRLVKSKLFMKFYTPTYAT